MEHSFFSPKRRPVRPRSMKGRLVLPHDGDEEPDSRVPGGHVVKVDQGLVLHLDGLEAVADVAKGEARERTGGGAGRCPCRHR